MRILRVLRNTGLALLALVVVISLVLVAVVRVNDGPIEILAGGPFTSGAHYSGPEPDWRFLHDRAEVAFQSLQPERSRVTWILEVDGRIFIPCGYMDTTWGRLWKQWPIEVEHDGRVLLRVDDVIYSRSLVRLTDDPVLVPVLAELSSKYVGGTVPLDSVSNGSLWIFEVVPRIQAL